MASFALSLPIPTPLFLSEPFESKLRASRLLWSECVLPRPPPHSCVEPLTLKDDGISRRGLWEVHKL